MTKPLIVPPTPKIAPWAQTVIDQKYTWDLDGRREQWGESSLRVSKNVLRAVHAPNNLIQEVAEMIAARKFIPGGRYLSNSGRAWHQTQNCLLLRAEDSSEGWGELMEKATLALMSGAGIGIDYSALRGEGKPIRRKGGVSTGPIALMQMINEAGRGIMQGGSRRSAIWAGLNWKHPDIIKFIHLKDWSPEVRALKEKDFNFPATMDMTNISVLLDDEFFEAYHNDKHKLHNHANLVYWETVRQMLKKSEPGFSIDTGANTGETLRNAPVVSGTRILTDRGYLRVKDIVDRPVSVWTGKQYAPNVIFTKTQVNAPIVKVSMTGGRSIRCEPSHEFLVERWAGVGKNRHLTEILRVKARNLQPGDTLHVSMPTVTASAFDRKSSVKVLSVTEDGHEDVYCADVKVDEHSFMAEGVIISNCTEITSSDDSDICNLGSINLAKIESLEEMKRVTELATIFLLAGTVYSDVPYAKVDQVRTKNRRLGLGLMGIHEWLLVRGKKYGPDPELEKYLEVYAKSGDVANEWADRWEISRPVKTRAIAPTGSIGIVGETTTGIEPLLCAAYKRRYLKHKTWAYQYVIDPFVMDLVEKGVNPDEIEDAYTLAEDVERRVQFQAYIQQYVDHAISSTINLPSWGSETNNENTVRDFGNMLIRYLPNLRGITCYPDGSRGGQPITPVKYHTAIKHLGKDFTDEGNVGVAVEYGDVCDRTRGGTCGE